MTKSIVIIDDEKDLRETLDELITEHMGLDSSCFSSVDSFLNILDQDGLKEAKVIISDIHMPTGSGLRITEELKSRKLDIPIIFISSMVDIIPKIDGVTMLRKPVSIEILVEKIKKLID